MKLSDLIPQPHVLDVRSLALLRILMGAMQLYDVYSRVSNGKYDVVWYTRGGYGAEPDDDKFSRLASMLPWLFTRHSEALESAHFAVFSVLSVCLMVGFQTRLVTPFIWLMVTVHQYKAPPLLDGSDMMMLQILLFMSFLPTAQVWSVDAAFFTKKKCSISTAQVSSLACLCLTLQIVMMYMGCFFARMADVSAGASDWLSLVLVHYAANGGGTYMSPVAEIIRETPILNELMTIGGFLTELVCPVLCFLGNQQYSHFFAMPLIMLHLGMGQILNLPHWIQLGCFMHVIWVPTHVWDRVTGKITISSDAKKKNVETASLIVIKREIGNVMEFLLLSLLVLTFGQSRGLVSQDFGSWTRDYGFLNSNWDMWSSAPRSGVFTMITGVRDDTETINLYRFIRTGEEVAFDDFSDEVLNYFTYDYPSSRWEKGIGNEWRSYLKITVPTMGKALCTMVNVDMETKGSAPLSYVEFVVHLRGVTPPDRRKTRWQRAKEPHAAAFAKQVSCDGGAVAPTKWKVEALLCFDGHESCDTWATAGECEHNTEYMHASCRLSCGLCQSTVGTQPKESASAKTTAIADTEPDNPTSEITVCVDDTKECAGWATAGECENNTEYMHAACRMSCGLCQGTTATKSEENTAAGTTAIADTEPENPTSESTVCADDTEECAGWAEDGECDKNADYMHAACHMSCGLC